MSIGCLKYFGIFMDHSNILDKIESFINTIRYYHHSKSRHSLQFILCYFFNYIITSSRIAHDLMHSHSNTL